MKNESNKISRIIDELNTYYLDKGAKKISICVENLYDQFKICFEVCDIDCSEEEISEMNQILNEARQPEVEAYYWTLSGESSDESELSLIGMMIDKAEISFSDSCLLVNLYRYK